MSTITCALQEYAPVDMKTCHDCFYKRMPDDISTVFCRKTIYDARGASFVHQLHMMRRRYVQLEQEREICRRSGRIEREEQIKAEEKKLQTEAERQKDAQEAAEELLRQAKEICDPRVTTAEEYLYENKKPFRALLDDGKDMHAFFSYIKENNVPDCAAAKKAAERFFE